MALADAFFGLRDRLIASPGFQRFAAAFPLTRPMARREASALFDLVAGFVYSQTLAAAVRLRLFELLRDGPLSLSDIVAATDLPRDGADRLMKAGVALRLFARRGEDRYGLGMLGAAMLGNPGVGAMVEHHALLYDDLRDPVALLRHGGETELSRYWAYARSKDPSELTRAEVDSYSALMAASQTLVRDEILDAYPLSKHRVLLDLGGGDGAFVTAAAQRNPNLEAMLFDLPAVAERAGERFAREGIAARARAFGGDFKADAAPRGADVVSLIRVLYDHDDESALRILRTARAALPPGGTLLIGEPMADLPGAERVGHAYFGLYLLAMRGGRPRSPADFRPLLREAGFATMRALPTRRPLLAGVLVAA
jgi:demethylspheroidene O-methyltransferase